MSKMSKMAELSKMSQIYMMSKMSKIAQMSQMSKISGNRTEICYYIPSKNKHMGTI